jgi:hypothetical protein
MTQEAAPDVLRTLTYDQPDLLQMVPSGDTQTQLLTVFQRQVLSASTAAGRENDLGRYRNNLVRHHRSHGGSRDRLAADPKEAAACPAAQGGTCSGVPAGERFHRE